MPFIMRFWLRLTANRSSVFLHQRSAVRIAPLFKRWTLLILRPTFSESYLLVPSKNAPTLAAPLGLGPRKPASETGVLPIRLKGNIYKTQFLAVKLKN